MKIQTLITALVLAAGGAAWAQAPAAPATPGIDKREANQQKRIDKGVASGQLTPRETARLEKREAKLAADEAAAKADGKVTPKERRKLQREAHRDSVAIHKQKHDAQTTAPAAK